MRRFRDEIFVFLLSLPILTPLMRVASVPCTHDGHLHYHRVAALKYAWQNGVYFSRWMPDLAFGLGYPFLIYREPFPLYSVLFLHGIGLPIPLAENLFYMICILMGGLGMLVWVRDLFGSWAGVVSAMAYMSAPYVLVDALIRGNLPETVGLAVAPWLMALGRRFLLKGKRGAWIGLMVSWVILGLSHNISLLLLAPTFLVYMVALIALNGLNWRTGAWRLVMSIALGIGLTLFYSGVAVTEIDNVTLVNSTNTRNNSFEFNYATLGEIFSGVERENSAVLNSPLNFRLGWVAVGLALAGIVAGFWRRRTETGDLRKDRERRGHVILLSVAAVLYLAMALEISEPLWENLPLIDFVQFPWRFVGRAALPISFLAGVPFSRGEKEKGESEKGKGALPVSLLLIPCFLLLLFVETVPNLYPNYCSETPYPTILDVFEYEETTGLVGVDPEGSYFPQTVQERPTYSSLVADYEQNRTPQRFDVSQLPEGAGLDYVIYGGDGSGSAEIFLTTPEPFLAHYLTFDFPGWQVWVDQQQVEITPSDPEGLITFPVSTGQHHIIIKWGWTASRIAFALVSLGALMGAIAVAIRGERGKGKVESALPDSILPTPYLLLIPLLLFGIKFTNDFLVSQGRQIPETGISTNLHSSELSMRGFDMPTSVPSGSFFDIDMVWETTAPPQTQYQTNVWLVDQDGVVWSDKNTERPRKYEDPPATQLWQPGQFAWDSREIVVLDGTPTGEYDVVLTFFRLDTLAPVPLVGDDGIARPETVIASITVTEPTEPAVFTPQVEREVRLRNGMNLLGYDMDRAEARPGDLFKLTLYFDETAGVKDVDIMLVLDDLVSASATWDLPIETSPNMAIRSQHILRLPAETPAGDYILELFDVPVGDLTVSAVERIMEKPTGLVPVTGETPFGVTLLGLNKTTSPRDTVELVWQRGDSPIETSYRTFVHWLDADGNIVAQSDGEPSAWSRPTTGWTAEEYIIDTHTSGLETMDGVVGLRVGMYEVNGENWSLEIGE